jgi:hypothetical protein
MSYKYCRICGRQSMKELCCQCSRKPEFHNNSHYCQNPECPNRTTQYPEIKMTKLYFCSEECAGFKKEIEE